MVNHLQLHRDMVEALVTSMGGTESAFNRVPTVDNYLRSMATLGTWGDNATLAAAVSHYKLKLVIINPDRTYFEVAAEDPPEVDQQWYALYYTGNHYELVYKLPFLTSPVVIL